MMEPQRQSDWRGFVASLQRPKSDVDLEQLPMGLSLMAVELRNWMRHGFRTAVAVFEIMSGSTSITAVGKLVAKGTEEE